MIELSIMCAAANVVSVELQPSSRACGCLTPASNKRGVHVPVSQLGLGPAVRPAACLHAERHVCRIIITGGGPARPPAGGHRCQIHECATGVGRELVLGRRRRHEQAGRSNDSTIWEERTWPTGRGDRTVEQERGKGTSVYCVNSFSLGKNTGNPCGLTGLM